MITQLNQVMLYVKSQQQSIKFFKDALQFHVIKEEVLPEDYRSYEIAPKESNETSIVIFDQEFIKKYSPMVSLVTPSLMFKTDDALKLREDMVAKGITVGEIMELPHGTVFNISDYEGNYFAVIEEK
ncbi:MAG: VOC family protein [Macrococcus canis]|uniref:VOC family protein n=1 Tax=Macrococcoides canis TaxID=1855823 RepID=UPI00105ED616|nr:VOC family protein [Macrococcus canis]MEE1106958.1 VOC family protein [Macrococcus canis]TDM38585.1 VOC family protein [Macrococcus canis]TDM42934.1 VOC family protein [Macrococcus canis]